MAKTNGPIDGIVNIIKRKLIKMNKIEIEQIIQDQRYLFSSHQTIPVDYRKAQLVLLKNAIQANEQSIQEALYADLGKGPKEAYMTEIGMVYSELSYMLKHLDSLAAQHYKWTPLHQFPSVSYTIDIPYGNVLIMSPWNYPFLLSMQPLVDAIAAGNTVVLKPSNYSPNVSAVLQQIISETFRPDYVACVTGGREENQALLDVKFDYIFFTGSKTVGHLVIEKSSKNLTPITLELGGKSPVIVDETANLALAAKRIVFGKFLNAGQTCVAPDYVMVHESVKDAFVDQIKHQIRLQYPQADSIGKIIDEKHFERLIGLIDPEKLVCGGMVSPKTLQIEPTVMDNVDWDDAVMHEEIFGPILPVMTYTDFEAVCNEIAAMPTPLAFYLFTRAGERMDWYKKALPFGSGCINDTIVQLSSDRLPFGGMGASGMGRYHGKYGFETFSHTKAILHKGDFDLPMRYSNAPAWCDQLLKMFLK